MRVAVVDLHRDAVLLASAMCASNASNCTACRPRARCGSSRVRSRRSRGCAGARRARRSRDSARRGAPPRHRSARHSDGSRRPREHADRDRQPRPPTATTRCRRTPVQHPRRRPPPPDRAARRATSGSTPSSISRCAVVVVHPHHERLRFVGIGQVFAPLRLPRLRDVRLCHQNPASIRGNSGARACEVASPVRARPTRPPRGRLRCGPRSAPPSADHSFAVDSGMIGDSSTARAQSRSSAGVDAPSRRRPRCSVIASPAPTARSR